MAEEQVPEYREGATLVSKLSKALRNFGTLPVEGGALAQAWMPVSAPDGSGPILQTKGLPYCLVGPGDMLALFRCLSCKYSFTSDLNKLSHMGAPGRVFLSGEAETSDNVQQCNISIYLRVQDAQACRVTSTVLLPVFAEPGHSQAVAVLEVTQFAGAAASYKKVFEWASKHLEEAGLFTPKQLETRTFEMQSHALSIRFFSSRDSALGCIFTDNGVAKTTAEPLQALEPAKTDLCSAAEKTSGGRVNEEAATPNVQEPRGAGGISDCAMSFGKRQSSLAAAEERGDEDDSGKGAQPNRADDEARELRGLSTAGASGSPSKASLTREDLEKYFGYGLKEAASRLGVCNTTLKRACRRHGIMKWPRRELLKNAKLEKTAAEKESQKADHQLYRSSSSLMAPSSGPANEQGATPLHLQQQLSHLLKPAAPAFDRNESELTRRLSLQHAASSTHLPAFANSLQQEQHSQAPGLPQAQGGTAEAPLSSALGPCDVSRLSQWHVQNIPQPVAGVAAPENPSRVTADTFNGTTGERRSSLGLVDTIFGESDGNELGAFLGEWSQQFANFSTGEEPHSMEHGGTQVVSQAVADHREGLVAAVHTKALDVHLPEIPETWPVEQPKDGHPDWAF